MKTIIKHIPNTITCLNLSSGAISIIMSFQQEFELALVFIIVAAVFDFFDGFAARLLKAYSEIGKELDSLADVISFGLAPAMMLFNLVAGGVDVDQVPWYAYCALFVPAFSALRLAKFNLDTRQTTSFLGLPTPANALFIAGLVAYSQYSEQLSSALCSCWFTPILSFVLGVLLVSEIPMFSLKSIGKKEQGKKNSSRETYASVIVVCIIGILIFLGYNTGIIAKFHYSLVFFIVFSIYLIYNIVLFCSSFFSKSKTL